MSHYLCELCGTGFDRPARRVYVESIDGHTRTDVEALCPVCLEPHFAQADSCPGCHGYKFRHEILCADCRRSLRKRITAFADHLTAEEEAQLDEWMDGDTITNRRKWK